MSTTSDRTARHPVGFATVLYASTLLVSAFLLFCVEPMVAKMLLPLLGGVPAVWSTCLVFFQGALLLGYVFALGSTQLLGPKRQGVVQLIAVGAPLLVMPIAIDEHLAEKYAGLGPVMQVLCVLSLGVGLPFFTLSTMAPTLQRWFSATGAKGSSDPYFLYAASNLGSLGALIAYPLFVEPALGLKEQSRFLRFGYFVLVALTIACAVVLWRGRGKVAAATKATEGEVEARPVTGKRRARWVFLALVPSAYLVAVTTHLTTDVAPVPLLWTLPLAVYLGSFVLVFATKPPISHDLVKRYYPVAVVAVLYCLAGAASDPAWALLPIHLLAFFGACMLCHGELARDRPEAVRLNEFYVWQSVGGFLGGILVALVVPALVVREIEYPVCVVLSVVAFGPDWKVARTALRGDVVIALAAGALVVGLAFASRAIGLAVPLVLVLAPLPSLVFLFRARAEPRRLLLVAAAYALAAGFLPSRAGEIYHRERNFFGAVSVSHDGTKWTQFNHGSTIHGRQSIDPAGRREPRGYHARSGPVGEIFRTFQSSDLPKRVAVVGLGAGAVAAYAKKGEEWVFYEINPSAITIAEDTTYFSYLADAFPDGAGKTVVLGDARLEIAKLPGGYGLVLMDAFNSDAVPIHLLTEEAMDLYVTKLAPGALILWNISNRNVDLRPVLGGLAKHAGFFAATRQNLDVSAADMAEGGFPSEWVVMSSDRAMIDRLGERWHPLPETPAGFHVWTDERSSLVPVLRWGR